MPAASKQEFGSVATRGDTVLAISVPFLPNQAEVYNMVAPTDRTDPLPPGGTCGETCIDIVDPNALPLRIRVGDVALLQVQSERRSIVVTSVTSGGVGVKHLTFSNATPCSCIRLVSPVGCGSRVTVWWWCSDWSVNAWYRNAVSNTLVRSDGVNLDGTLRTSITARGVDSFTTRLQFTNDSERTQANWFDSDTANDYDRIVSVVVRARMRVERTDLTVNGGAPFFRFYEWRLSARNQAFERHRGPLVRGNSMTCMWELRFQQE